MPCPNQPVRFCSPPCHHTRSGRSDPGVGALNMSDGAMKRWVCVSFQRAIDDVPFSRYRLGLTKRCARDVCTTFGKNVEFKGGVPLHSIVFHCNSFESMALLAESIISQHFTTAAKDLQGFARIYMGFIDFYGFPGSLLPTRRRLCCGFSVALARAHCMNSALFAPCEFQSFQRVCGMHNLAPEMRALIRSCVRGRAPVNSKKSRKPSKIHVQIHWNPCGSIETHWKPWRCLQDQ